MNRRLTPLALVALFLIAPTCGFASRARVEAVGNLEFLLEDETATLTPFRVGNPAGLALIPRVNRFDLSGQWRYEEFNYASGTGRFRAIRRTFSNLPALLGPETIQYDGWTLFPTPKFSVQAGGTFYAQDDAYDFAARLSEPNPRKGFARAAYDLGIAQVGVEARLNGHDERFAPGLLEPGIVLEDGEIRTQDNTVTGGLLFRFPKEPAGDQLRVNVGGLYALMPMSPRREETYTVLVEPASLRMTITSLYRITEFASYGPDAFLEIPGKLQAGLFARMTASEGTLERTSSETAILPNQAESKASESKGRSIGGGVRITRPVSDFTDFKGGIFVSSSRTESDGFAPDGTRSFRNETDHFEMALGAGLASDADYAVGFQYTLRTEGGNEGIPPLAELDQEAADQSFRLGGEHWISNEWALRMGLTGQLVENRGNRAYRADLFSTEPLSRVFASYLTAGVGLKRARFGADLRVHVGQASYLTGDTDRFATLGGALVTATMFF